MKLYRPYKILTVIPVFTFVLSCLLTNVFGPYYLAGNIDPEYVELFNALSIPTFHIPPNTSHPGTTLHVLGAVVIFVKWLAGVAFGSGWDSLESSVLLHPEDYLHSINLVVSVLTSVSMYFAAAAVYKRSGSRLSAIVLQLSFFVFTQTVFAQFRVSPEPLLAAVAFTLIALLTPVIFPAKPDAAPPDSRIAGACGAVFGIGLVTKVNFFPFGAVVLLFKGYKQKLWFLLTAIASMLVFLLPSLPGFREKTAWFSSLVTHSGFYGSGPKGLPPPSVLGENARAIFGYEPYLCVLFVCYTILLVAVYFERRRRVKRDPRFEASDAALLAGWIAIAVQLALVIQHFRAHYLLPALLTACLLNSIVAFRLASPGLGRPTKAVLGVAGAALMCAGVLHTGKATISWISQVRRERADVQALAAKAKTMPQCKQVGYYRSSLPLYALHFGNGLASNQQSQYLSEQFPESLAYAVHEGKFYSFSGADKTDYVTNVVRSGGCVLIQGQSLEGVEQFWPKQLIRDPVDVRPYEGLYRLVYSAEPVPQGPAAVGTLLLSGTIAFPRQTSGVLETLLTTGKPGSGDFFFVEYLSSDRVRFRYDKWGVGGPAGPAVPVTAGKEYAIEIRYENGVLRFRLDGHTALECQTTLYPTSRSQMVAGANSLGGSLPLRPFSGQLQVSMIVTPL